MIKLAKFWIIQRLSKKAITLRWRGASFATKQSLRVGDYFEKNVLS